MSQCRAPECIKNARYRGLCTGHFRELHPEAVQTLRDFEPEYGIYKLMLKRCSNPNDSHYHRYGGRGIKVCDEWKGRGGYSRFLSHVGRRPSPKYSVDRINNNGNYEPGNVRWATKHEQAANTSRNNLNVGVSYDKTNKRWVANLAANGKSILHTLHESEKEALAARNTAIFMFMKYMDGDNNDQDNS